MLNQWVLCEPALPEIALLGGLTLIVLIDLFLTGKKSLTFYLSELLLVFVFVSLHAEKSVVLQVLFNGQYLLDPFAVLMKEVMVTLVFLILAYAKSRDEFEHLRSEFIFLTLFSLLGGMVIASAMSLLTLYLGLELLSLPLYALIALKRDSSKSGEAAIKYFVMGAMASGFLLFGFSLLYGLTGSLELPQIAMVLANTGVTSTDLVLLVMILAAIAFKLGIVPFHMWIADVYEGAPLSVTAYLACVPKLAVIALFVRIFLGALGHSALMGQHVLFTLGVLSMVLGNCLALVQKSLRRLLAYSTVANMGLVFLAFALVSPEGYTSALFYAVTYTAASAAAFGLLLNFNRDIVNLEDLKGLHQHRPYIAFLFLIVMLSLLGMPPLIGFEAKFLVVASLFNQGHTGLAVFTLVMSVVAAAYYLKVLKAIYFDHGSDSLHFKLNGGWGLLAININAWALLILGLFPAAFMMVFVHLFG